MASLGAQSQDSLHDSVKENIRPWESPLQDRDDGGGGGMSTTSTSSPESTIDHASHHPGEDMIPHPPPLLSS